MDTSVRSLPSILLTSPVLSLLLATVVLVSSSLSAVQIKVSALPPLLHCGKQGGGRQEQDPFIFPPS